MPRICYRISKPPQPQPCKMPLVSLLAPTLAFFIPFPPSRLAKMQRGPRLLDEGASPPRTDRYIVIRTAEIIFPKGCPCHPESLVLEDSKPTYSSVQSLPGLPWKRRESQNLGPVGSAASSTLGESNKNSKSRPWYWMNRKTSSSSSATLSERS